MARRLPRPPGPAIPPRAPALRLVETLTEREAQVPARRGRHLTNEEIAAALSISPLTAKRHVSHLCGKLGAATRRQRSPSPPRSASPPAAILVTPMRGAPARRAANGAWSWSDAGGRIATRSFRLRHRSRDGRQEG